MMDRIELRVAPEVAYNEVALDEYIQNYLEKRFGKKLFYLLDKRSIDARKQVVKINLFIRISEKEIVDDNWNKSVLEDVSNKPEVVIVGAGPAGLFAAIKLIELGIRPVVLDRGKDVQSRRRDLANINKKHIVNPDSNYCFGEGGAGTYSDGKLYTRASKRGNVNRILEILVDHGAHREIMVDAHPHIGTNKLPKIVTALRETIESCGGEVLFNNRVDDFIIENDEIKGVKVNGGVTYKGEAVILATGHSARDIFKILQNNKVKIESKPFALGVRIEHHQSLIDSIQYHCDSRGEYLPAAAYTLKTQIKSNKSTRGVFSFCMCPGGFIVPAATAPGEVVVNGMSPSKRDSKYANSGTVVAVGEEDFAPFRKEHGDLAGMALQASIEASAWEMGGKTQMAPAQRMVDFVDSKISPSLPDTSYQPGLNSSDLGQVLGKPIRKSLRYALKNFGKMMKGYYTNDAVLVGVESRTSSPVLVPRERDTLEHVQINRLYPCGEGAGYAGGIVSAAIDGERVAQAIFEQYF